MKQIAHFVLTLIKLNLLSAWNRKRGFWMQVIFMMVNNLIFFVFWWMIFQKVKDLNGYGIKDMAVIYGLSAGAWGLSVVFAGGRRLLAQHVADGQIDPWLAQPKPLLPHMLLSQCYPSGIGDFISAFVLWGMTDYGHGPEFLMYLLAMISGALVFVGTGVIAHSLAFWLGPILPLARQYEEFMIFFSVNPQNVFSMGIKIVIFSILPAGMITYLPVEAIRQNNWSMLILAFLGAAVVMMLGALIFKKGLRLYSSGSGVSIRA